MTLRLIKFVDQNYTFKSSYNEQNDPSQRRGGVVVDSTTGLAISPIDIDAKHDVSARLSIKLPLILRELGEVKAVTENRAAESSDYGALTTKSVRSDTSTITQRKPKRKSPFIFNHLFT